MGRKASDSIEKCDSLKGLVNIVLHLKEIKEKVLLWIDTFVSVSANIIHTFVLVNLFFTPKIIPELNISWV